MQVDHEHFMRLALSEAERAGAAGEVPIGAVLVVDDEVVATGYNEPIGLTDPTAHAEMIALRRAALSMGNYRVTGASLYVTVEPCLMCVGAMVHARVGTLVYGTVEPRMGAVTSIARGLEIPGLNHRVSVVPGVLEQECRALMQEFFRRKRAIAAESCGLNVEG